MQLLHQLWDDESGAIVSAELVLLGTLGVVGVGVGAAAVSESVDAELEELSLSIRSLDQSYHIQGFQGGGAWTAGSCYTQPPVEESRAALQERIHQRRAEAARGAADESATPAAGDAHSAEPAPQDSERRRERRRRMQQRESERRQRDGDENWDGDEQRDADSERG